MLEGLNLGPSSLQDGASRNGTFVGMYAFCLWDNPLAHMAWLPPSGLNRLNLQVPSDSRTANVLLGKGALKPLAREAAPYRHTGLDLGGKETLSIATVFVISHKQG